MAPTEPADVRLYGAMDYAVSTLRAVAPRVSSFPQLTAYERWVYRDHGGRFPQEFFHVVHGMNRSLDDPGKL